MITKWILMRVRPLRPFRIGFLTTDEINRLMDNGKLTVPEVQRVMRMLKDAERFANQTA